MSKKIDILEFLEYIVKNQTICTKNAAEYFGVSEKTIRRRIQEVEQNLGYRPYKVGRGCYSFVMKDSLSKLIPSSNIPSAQEQDDFEKLVDLLVMVDEKLLRFLDIDPKILDRLKSKYAKVYKLHSSPFEELVNSKLLPKIKNAIKNRKKINILYVPDEEIYIREAKPIKILFAEGNWYLAVMTKDEVNSGFKFLRINFIKEIEELPKQFHTDYEAERFVESFQSLFSSFGEASFDVEVIVDKEVSRHFRHKKFLKSQQILEDDGDLRIRYRINNDNEILLLAKRWMPHMRIVKPERLQRTLEAIAREFLNKTP